MNKPIDLVVVDTKQALINVIAQSRLPHTVVCMILNELTETVRLQTQQSLANSRAQYEQAMAEEAKAPEVPQA